MLTVNGSNMTEVPTDPTLDWLKCITKDNIVGFTATDWQMVFSL